jgi:hypothetical protein
METYEYKKDYLHLDSNEAIRTLRTSLHQVFIQNDRSQLSLERALTFGMQMVKNMSIVSAGRVLPTLGTVTPP